MTARGAATRKKLIEATTHVVGEVGYARATTRAIAEAAGVAEGTIYRHFPHKQQLFFAAVFEQNAEVMAWVEGLPALAGTRTVRENLHEVLHRLQRLRDDVLPLEIAIRADPELTREHVAAMRATMPAGPPPGPPDGIARYLAAEQELGRIRADVDPFPTAVVLLATLIGIGMLPAAGPPGLAERLLDVAADTLLDGLAPR